MENKAGIGDKVHRVVVAPNAYIVENKLYVNGGESGIMHSTTFQQLVAGTAARVSTVLALVLGDRCKVPTVNGGVSAEAVEAWSHYSVCALNLASAKNHEQIVEIGGTMLAWCAVACLVADIRKSPERDTDDFQIMRYIAGHGYGVGRAPHAWENYMRALAEYKSLPIAARMDTREPMPPAGLNLSVAWPSLLGIDVGGENKLLEQVFSIATDIVVSPTHSIVFVGGRVGNVLFILRRLDELVTAYDEALGGNASEGSFSYTVAENQYIVRATVQGVSALKPQRRYSLRIYPQAVPLMNLSEDMDALRHS